MIGGNIVFIERFRQFLAKRILMGKTIPPRQGDATEAEMIYSDILKNLSDAIFLTDHEGAFVYVSPNVERIFGYSQAEVFAMGRIDNLLRGELFDPEEMKLLGELRDLPFEVVDKWGKTHSLQIEIKQVSIQKGTWLYTCRDISDRKATEDALRNSEKLLQRVLDTLPVGVWVTDSDGHITLSNPEDKRIWSWSSISEPDDYNTRKVWLSETGQLLAPENRAIIRAIRHGEITLNEVVEIESIDGVRKTILNSAVPIRDEQGSIVGGIAVNQDITEQRRMEIAERKHRTFANALNNITAMLTGSLDLETVMERILDNVGRVVPHEAANIMLIEEDKVRVAFWHNYGPKCDELFRTKLYPLKMPMLSRMLETGLPQLVADTKAVTDWSEFSETAWIRSSVGVPIRARDVLLGFLILDSSEPGFFQPPDAERLRAFAYQAAIAIENARLFSTVREYANELEVRVVERTVELQQAKDQVEAILEYSNDGIALVNDRGEIFQVNLSFQQLFGFDETVEPQPTLAAFVDDATWGKLASFFSNPEENEAPYRVDLICRSLDGRVFDADMAIAPLIDHAEGDTRYICNVRDVTKQKLAESELRSALLQEKELNELKSRFVAMVSHEFRTPLASIQTSTDLLYSYYERLSLERRNEIIIRVQTQIKRLTGLLEDVLMIAKADSVGLILDLATVDLKVLCEEVINDLGFSVAKNRAIELGMNTTGPLMVELDPKLFQRVLENLLTNAIKYSPADSRIDLELEDANEQVVIQIRDHGIGVPKEDMPGLFEAFHRANNVGDRQGTGLGLAIVKRAIDAHHGTVIVESELEVGTNFRITLPKKQPVSETPVVRGMLDW